jgi:hypothetical protein
MPWLGELCPDYAYSQWIATDAGGAIRGNLVAGGSAATDFFHSGTSATYNGSTRTAYGTGIGSPNHVTNAEGCTSMFNCGTNAATFHHRYSSGSGTLTATGLEIADNYNFVIMSSAPLSRPFGVAAAGDGGLPAEWSLAPYDAKSTATVYRSYFSHAQGTGSGAVRLVDPANTNAAYFLVNGLDRTAGTGSSFIAKYAVLSLVHTFLEAGELGSTFRIKMTPRVEIVSPTDISEVSDPSSIDIQVAVRWQRWDGLPYTATGSYDEAESELDYVVMYSKDGGASWRFIQDGTAAMPGERPASSAYIEPDAGDGDETFELMTPEAEFPQGSYLLQVDCYRRGSMTHYAHHRTKIFVQR